MKWTHITAMQKSRAGHSIAALSGKLFASGGWSNGNIVTNSVESYDPHLDRWTSRAPMNVRRRGHRCAVFNNILYAVGGCDRNGNFWNSIEKYDELADKWTVVIYS